LQHGRQDEGACGIYDIFVLIPEKGEIVYEFGQVRLKDRDTRNHSARNNGVVGSIVSVTDRSWLRSYAPRVFQLGAKVVL
jgi:hypothetical protein